VLFSIAVIAGSLYFLILEAIQCYQTGARSYLLEDGWNYIDIMPPIVIIGLTFTDWLYYSKEKAELVIAEDGTLELEYKQF